MSLCCLSFLQRFGTRFHQNTMKTIAVHGKLNESASINVRAQASFTCKHCKSVYKKEINKLSQWIIYAHFIIAEQTNQPTDQPTNKPTANNT